MFCSHSNSSCEGWHWHGAFAESVLVCFLANGSKWVGTIPLWTSQVAESIWRRHGFAIESFLTVPKQIWMCTVGKNMTKLDGTPQCSLFISLLLLRLFRRHCPSLRAMRSELWQHRSKRRPWRCRMWIAMRIGSNPRLVRSLVVLWKLPLLNLHPGTVTYVFQVPRWGLQERHDQA